MRSRSIDVVVGIAETHDARIPRRCSRPGGITPRIVEYRDAQLREFDLDGALVRRPA